MSRLGADTRGHPDRFAHHSGSALAPKPGEGDVVQLTFRPAMRRASGARVERAVGQPPHVHPFRSQRSDTLGALAAKQRRVLGLGDVNVDAPVASDAVVRVSRIVLQVDLRIDHVAQQASRFAIFPGHIAANGTTVLRQEHGLAEDEEASPSLISDLPLDVASLQARNATAWRFCNIDFLKRCGHEWFLSFFSGEWQAVATSVGDHGWIELTPSHPNASSHCFWAF